MRNAFFATASVAATLLGGQALAQSGYVGANYSSGDISVGGLSADADAWGVEGSLAFGSGIGGEIDFGFADSDNSDSATAVTGHLFSRSEGALFGGFAGVTNSDGDSTWNAGGEAQAYLDNVTLGGAVTYLSNDDANVDGWGVNGAARIFATDNLAFGGNVGWFTLDGGGAEANATTYGAGVEYQLDAMPISFLAAYNRFDIDDFNTDGDAWTVGVRYNFGGTLKDRDRTGAGLAGLSGVSALQF